MITAFIVVFAGFFVLKKWVLVTFTAILLSGCGYKGALYIPQAPEQTTPTEKPDETVSSPNTQSQPASTPGESH